MKFPVRIVSAVFLCCAFSLPSCGDDETPKSNDNGDDGRPDDTGAACEVADDCFPEVTEGELQGEAVCIDRVREGYCTHTCETDDDCCAADGECDDSVTAVCSPFESMTGLHCFLSCEDADTGAGGAGGAVDAEEFCQKNAGTDFICRSSGGGVDNRRICVPGACGVGADCTDEADCDAGLECLTTVDGGYCTVRGCTVNTDCPGMDDRCVTVGDENFCYRSCTQESHCTLCRHDSDSTCSTNVTFADGTTTGSVCVPG
jgi:hypothetical protein